MAEIPADFVKKLREKTGARMMDCKKALESIKAEFSDKGEQAWLDGAESWLRTKSLAAGGAIQERAAAEGLLGYKLADDGSLTVVEMTANTDFVAKNPEFLKLLNDLVELSVVDKLTSADQLNAKTLGGVAVSDVVKSLAGKIGENISIKRVVRFDGEIGYYIHHDNKQGAIVEIGGLSGDAAKALGKDLSMHIVFAKPSHLTRDEVSPELIKKESDIAAERLKSDPKNASKPADILNKIVAGQVNKFYSTLVLPDQPYYKDGNKTVAQILKESGNATVKRFVRFEVGVV